MRKVLFILCLLWAAAPAGAALHCGQRLVDQGDPQYYVAEVCPEPYWVERWEIPLDYNYYSGPYNSYGYSAQRYEAWYINFGPRRLIRRLVFLNGYLQHEETLGRGVAFRPGSRRCSPRDLRVAGESAGEIYAHCGQPDYIYDEPVTVYPRHRRHGVVGPAHVVYRARWIYNFGSRHFDRELVFEDGRLLSIREVDP